MDLGMRSGGLLRASGATRCSPLPLPPIDLKTGKAFLGHWVDRRAQTREPLCQSAGIRASSSAELTRKPERLGDTLARIKQVALVCGLCLFALSLCLCAGTLWSVLSRKW